MSDEQSPSRKYGRLQMLRFAAEYAAFRAAVAALRAIDFDRASAISGKLWEWLAPHTYRHARALQHLSVAFPEKTIEERQVIARAAWNNLGRTAAEAISLDVLAEEPARIRLVSPEVMQRILDNSGKCVVAPMHYGNWEAIAPALTRYNLSGALIYQRVRNPYGEQFIRDTRLKYCAGGMYPKSERAVRRLVSWVRAGNGIVILADQRSRGAEVKFFGHIAPSTPLPAYIARNFDAPLIAARIVRTDGANFDLELKEVPVPRDGDRDRDIAEATQSLHSIFENWIRENPEQWMWAHRRWSRRGPPKSWSPSE